MSLLIPGYILFLVIFGSLNTLTTKWQFQITSTGSDGRVKEFQKPWWGNFAMFLSMLLVLFIHKGQEWYFERWKRLQE